MSIYGIIAAASNVRGGTNPPYTAADFKTIYPQFFDSKGKPIIPPEVLDMYIQLAHGCVKESRYREAWRVCMSWFVAHFVSLYMQAMVDPELDEGPQQVMNAARTKGLVASKSVGDQSLSYDFNAALQDLDGWAAWKLTSFGTQFATQAKILSIGGMYVH